MFYPQFDGENPILMYRNGIKIMGNEPKKIGRSNQVLALHELLDLPHCIYFSDTASQTVIINTNAVKKCGYVSTEDAIGKTIHAVATRETANHVIKTHQHVMHTHSLHIGLDEVHLKYVTSFTCMSIVRPWYDENDKLLGIFGCSIDLINIDISKTLQTLVNVGLLNTQALNGAINKKGFIINNQYFSPRETQCIRYYIRGKTVNEIARILNLSPRTIQHYLENVKYKIGVTHKNDLISYIIDHTNGEI